MFSIAASLNREVFESLRDVSSDASNEIDVKISINIFNTSVVPLFPCRSRVQKF